MADLDTADLRILRAVAQRGSFTGAAAELGYTQSAISRRVAAMERAAGRTLFRRERVGAQLTEAGEVLLGHAGVALAALDAAARELEVLGQRRAAPVRIGAFGSAAAGIVPQALATVALEHPGLTTTLREGTTAVTLRALRAGAIDLALVASTPPFGPVDAREPALVPEVLSERELMLAVGAGHRLAGRRTVRVEELVGERWIAARSEGEERLLGVWPGLAGTPDLAYVARDWLTKLRFVASGAAITTIPGVLLPALPPGVQALRVVDGPRERRRLLLVRAPTTTPSDAAIDAVAEALRRAATAAP
ncbi:MAG: LysR family transcriptional regulator [Solirubrobacteraceae bacterium]|nr:LysR family transcriptional regulator [Solirubrobacteraceae bacterium]